MLKECSALQAWNMLKNDPTAQLVDVRSAQEWHHEGIPSLADLQKKVLFLTWNSFDDQNETLFTQILIEKLTEVSKESPIIFLCRSGVRSQFAATSMLLKGYKNCYNLIDGIGAKSNSTGWKMASLPWIDQPEEISL